MLDPIIWGAVLLPVLFTLPIAIIFARSWRQVVVFKWPELLLAPIPTAAWNFLCLIPGRWHPGKGWGNLLELMALGMLSTAYVFFRRYRYQSILGFPG